MSLIITRNFKRAKAQDAAAKDAKFKVGDKVFLRGQGGGVCTIVRIGPKPAPGKYGAGWAEETFDVKRDRDGVMFTGLVETDLRLANSRATDSRAMDAKFKKGDKVVSVKTGAQGVVNEVYGEEKYAVLFNGAANPDRVEGFQIRLADNSRAADACEDSIEFHVGQRVRAKDPRWTGYQGHALGNGIYTVKKVDRDGTVKLDGFLDVWISPSALVEANDACGKGEDAKNDFANRIMPLVRRIADAQKVIEGVLGEAEDLGYEAAHGEFPDSTFAKRSANQLEEACYEAVTALRKVKTIAVL